MNDPDVAAITAPMRRTMLAMHTGEGWMTASEITGATGMALTLLAVRSDPSIERRRARWGGEPGQRHGSGYEYRLTARGRAIRAALDTDAANT